ncbi:hypothetical protein NUW58_g7538 [Xylaria curta]|uniref:Uncharacterized protein n=1 Tax=Xylaria curta TaxID=42375 RepID=A0ACC1NG94_9PEZI|nr:hypothetical protein NUW58_g7538 [Xylaria curta]
MASTVVLITGVGLGNALARAYLSRPNHVVIGSVRDSKGPTAQELNKLPTAAGSRLVLVSIENTSTTDAKKAAQDIEAAGLDHIDIVISNTAISHPPAPLEAVDTELFVEAFRVNAISSVLLFQAVTGLLTKSSAPKWISVSSRPGSIAQPAEFYWYIGPYGMSKAAQNWFTSTINTVVTSLTAFAIHPGFVQTDMGNEAARLGGLEKPPTTAEDSAANIIKAIDAATRETTAGKFIDVETGEVIEWTSHPAEIMAPWFQNQSCVPFADSSVPCTLGNLASYSIDVRNANDVAAGLAFAKKQNIRLVIKNSGHDFNGRSTGKGALSLWTHNLKSMEVIPAYKASYYRGPAIKIGAGVQGGEAAAFASAHGYRWWTLAA